jgi:DNA-binding response OmpR family regulator
MPIAPIRLLSDVCARANRPRSEAQALLLEAHRGSIELADLRMDRGLGGSASKRRRRLWIFFSSNAKIAPLGPMRLRPVRGSRLVAAEVVMRVLVVEDEAAVAESIKDTLERSGFRVNLASNGEDAWFLGDTEDFAAVVLDLGLPRMDGLSVLRRWRASGRRMPVIILTARATWMERVDGIDAGADDYLAKPFQMEELLARLHAVLRRSAGQAMNALTIGNLVVDQRRKSVTANGVPVDLTPLEFSLLCCFVLRPGEVISASDLLDQVYGHDNEKDANVLEALLGRLRRKIGSDVIATRRGQGYFLRVDG